jgi:catechol 2,3-dioxygenase-like lactoylglutathione lyase family enzyme/limonene-1,2-epoxide hydrolase
MPHDRNPGPLEVVVGWMDAMRRGDYVEVEAWLDPRITWRGVHDVAVCRGREEVLYMLRGSLEGGFGAEAIELIPGDCGTVLGALVPGLAETGGIELRGQFYNVFRVRSGRILAVDDYPFRDEALAAAGAEAPRWATAPRAADVVDLIPFVHVVDVERAIPFYEALGFAVIKRHQAGGTLEFAGLRASRAAKIMLARVDEPPDPSPPSPGPGFLYLYTNDLAALRDRLLAAGHHADEIEEGPGPGPRRQMCVRDPDGHGHMVAELFEGSVADG